MIAAALLFFLACAQKPAAVATNAPVSEAAEAIAPRPFDADQLRAGIPQGTTIRLTVAQAGKPTVEQRWEFVSCTAESATIASKVYDTSGTLLEDEGVATSTWAELNEHATFPAAATVREDAVLDGPLGHLETWRYTVTSAGDDGVMLVKRYDFAKTLPGPPALFTIERQGEEILRMAMIERR